MTPAEVIERAATSRYNNDYTATHARRFGLCIEEVSRVLPPRTPILDVGWPTIFTSLLIEREYPVKNFDRDIRVKWEGVDDGSVDAVFLMEVVEHLKDPDGASFDTFLHMGLQNALAEVRRVLKPDGYLFLTTPNQASYGSIKRLLHGGNPMLFSPHTREYTASEIEWWVGQAGLRLVERKTIACYEQADPIVVGAMNSIGASLANREDTTVIWARK